MPSRTFAASATTSASIDQIWQTLQVPETWEAISGVDDVFEPEFDGGELVGFKFHSTAGGRRYLGTASPGPRDKAKSLSWVIKNSEIRGEVVVGLQPADGFTRIEIAMTVESVSVMASFGFPLIAGAIATGFQEAVDDFVGAMSN